MKNAGQGQPDPRLVYLLAAGSGANHRTVRTWLLTGREPRGADLVRRLRDAARKLGVDLPGPSR